MTNQSKQVLKEKIKRTQLNTLQFNITHKCHLECIHCHHTCSPENGTEATIEIIDDVIQVLNSNPTITHLDITGGAPELHPKLKYLIETVSKLDKQITLRSNFMEFSEKHGIELAKFLADNNVTIAGSLPCYLESNVTTMRGNEAFEKSISAIKLLNEFGYGREHTLTLVYNPSLKSSRSFSLPPEQTALEKAYKERLLKEHGISFTNLITIMNMPLGRTKTHLEHKGLLVSYMNFLEKNFNESNCKNVMCSTLISVAPDGSLYDCDFHQAAKAPMLDRNNTPLNIKDLFELNELPKIQIFPWCLGCCCGSGSGCQGTLS
jgi:radical SAM/Cys-rich protein